MIRSMGTAEKAMNMEQVRIDALANNLANVNSAGFKQILTRVAQPGGSEQPGGRADSVQANRAQISGRSGTEDSNWSALTRMDLYHAVDTRPGPIAATGRQTDIAIMGEGFFEVAASEGNLYTRSGSFSLNAQHQLTTAAGQLVQGDGGPIKIDGNEFTIASDGSVAVDGKTVGRLKLVSFPDPSLLEHVGDSMLRAPEDQPPTPLTREQTVVAQSHLEGSNVNPIDTLVAMISAQRAFEVQSSVLKTEDEMLSKSVNNLPRVSA